jgi:hypothetical protein
MSTLRIIAVHVEEAEPGQFTWVLTERGGAQWTDVGRADAPSDTYQRAMAEGLLALQSMVDDLDIGPRGPKAEAAPKRGKAGKAAPKSGEAEADADADADADAESDNDADADAAADQAEAASKRKAFFGFGPAR